MNPSQFESHQLFDKIEQLSERLSEDKVKEKLDLETIDFFESAISYLNDRLKLTIPILVQNTEMNSISSELQNSLQQLNNYLSNNNEGHVSNAKNNIHSALNRLRNLPLPFAKNDFNFSKVAANFQKSIKNKYNELESKKAELENQITSFQEDLENKEKEIDRLFKLVEEKETQIQNLNSQFETEFKNIKSSSIQEFDSDRKKFRAEIDKEKDAFQDEMNELIESKDTDTTKIVENLSMKLDEASKIVNVIGNIGVTGNYQIIANEHKQSADFWRWVAIGFMTVFSLILVWTIYDLSEDMFDWTKSLIRLIGAAALSYPATYAARESSRHRKLETFNRKAELELASINPFIETLEDNKKQTIKEKLVEKYFGNSNSSESSDPNKEELSLNGFEKLIKSIMPLLKK